MSRFGRVSRIALPLACAGIALTCSPALADDSGNAALSASIASLIGLVWLFVILLVVGLIALRVWIFWMILTKAGFNPALAFLALISLGSLALVLILAFGRWPIEDELARLRVGTPAPLSTL